MNRLAEVGKIVDEILMKEINLEERNCGLAHLYGVSTICGILALKRGLDVELCKIAGMLHDIWSYKAGYCKDHGRLGSGEAMKILTDINSFSTEEMDIICSAIYSHSSKETLEGPYEELLKDADALQHYLHNTSLEVKDNERYRLLATLEELGINNREGI